jgi:hypothetical protein
MDSISFCPIEPLISWLLVGLGRFVCKLPVVARIFSINLPLQIGQQAQTNLATSRMVGTEIFTAELQRLAALDGKLSEL